MLLPKVDHVLIKRCPGHNGRVEFNRTLETEWAYRTVFDSIDQRTPSRTGETTAASLR